MNVEHDLATEQIAWRAPTWSTWVGESKDARVMAKITGPTAIRMRDSRKDWITEEAFLLDMSFVLSDATLVRLDHSFPTLADAQKRASTFASFFRMHMTELTRDIASPERR